ncbi:MAG: hypothetical protein O2820_18525 [Planctomycetota bacterium]|nr:hypothetical protein [Planctomycetota bacterium]MDA1251209.1 hypothetical protein [Planctomycetota bacterium]
MTLSIVQYDMSILTLVIGAVVLALLFVGGAFAARVTSVNPAAGRNARWRRPERSGLMTGAAVVTGLAVFFSLAIFKYRGVEVRTQRPQEARMPLEMVDSQIVAHQATMRTEEAARKEPRERPADSRPDSAVSESSGTTEVEETSAASAIDLPPWTRNPLTVLARGKVEDVLFVAQSDLCATTEEAEQEATVRAIAALQNRVVVDWPELNSWSIPVDAFQSAAVRQKYISVEMHEFAGRKEPMYRVFLQVEDSAIVREQLLDLWKTDVASVRAQQIALGLGGLGIGLGLISALLRGLLAVSNPRQKTVVTAVTILVVLGGLGTLFVV